MSGFVKGSENNSVFGMLLDTGRDQGGEVYGFIQRDDRGFQECAHLPI